MGGDEVRAVLGKNIRKYRNKRNWSQSDLAEHAGISLDFISNIERGNKWPYPDTLFNIAQALDVEIDLLFKRQNDALAEAIEDANREVMRRFIKDVSLSVQKSLNASVQQSLDYVSRQYSLG